MSRLEWPPETTFKYEFNKNLDLEIPVKDGGKEISNNKGEERD